MVPRKRKGSNTRLQLIQSCKSSVQIHSYIPDIPSAFISFIHKTTPIDHLFGNFWSTAHFLIFTFRIISSKLFISPKITLLHMIQTFIVPLLSFSIHTAFNTILMSANTLEGQTSNPVYITYFSILIPDVYPSEHFYVCISWYSFQNHSTHNCPDH